MVNFQTAIKETDIAKDDTKVNKAGGFPKTYPLNKEFDLGNDKMPLKFNAGAQLEIDVISKSKKEEEDSLNVLLEDGTYVSYGIDINAGLSAGFESENIKASLDAETSLKSSFWTKQNNNAEIGPTILKDLVSYKTFYNKSDLNELETDNILSIEWQGKLNAKATFSWSSVVSGSISSVLRSINQEGVLDIDVTSGVEIGIDVSFSDHFVMAVKRLDAEKFQLFVLKKKNSNKSFSLDAGVTVEFSDADKAQDLITHVSDQIIERLTKTSEANLITALENVDNKVANVKENAIVTVLLKLLPEELLQKVDISLLEKYQEYKKYLNEKIKDGVKRNVKLNFGFQYSKIKSSEEVLSCKLSLNNLETYHQNLIKFDIKPILDAILKNDKGLELISYLRLQEIKITKTWGFSLTALGIDILGKQNNEKNISIRYNLENFQQVTDQRLYTYKSKIGKWNHDWGVELLAKMPSFSKIVNHPTQDEFQHTFSLVDISGGNIKNENTLREHLDTAFLWGFYSDIQIDQTITSLYTDIEKLKDKNIVVSTQIKFSQEASQMIINAFGTKDYSTNKFIIEKLALAMGASMPFLDIFEERKYPASRTRIYAPIWKLFIEGKIMPENGVDFSAFDYLKQMKLKNQLIELESVPGTNSNITMADIVKTNNINMESITRIFNGFKEISNQITNKKSYGNDYANSVDKIKGIQSNSFYARAFGRFLIDILQVDVQKQHVECITTISFEDEKGKKAEKVLALV